MITTRNLSVLERIRTRRKAKQKAHSKALVALPVVPPKIAQRLPTITLNQAEAKALDAYYTRPHVAKFVANVMRTFAPKGAVYLEPSAGGGAILDQFPDAIGLDLCPTREDIIKADFLKANVAKVAGLSADQRKRLVIVGNPPFGVGAELAVKFLNKALTLADTVGFIMPQAFGYHEVQQHVARGARLIVDIVLPKQGFTLAGRSQGVMSRFQIWTTRPATPGSYVYQGEVTSIGRGKKAVCDRAKITCRVADDLRLTEPDELQCTDFAMERSRGKAKLFNLAVPFRRSKEYVAQITRDPTKLVPGFEYWMVQVMPDADVEAVIARLMQVDFKAISLKHNHNGQRFVAVDFMRAYARLKANEALAPVPVVAPVNDNVHSAPIPLELPLTAIKGVSSAKVIFDPFTGTGATGVAARTAGRQFVGAELDPHHVAKARARTEATEMLQLAA